MNKKELREKTPPKRKSANKSLVKSSNERIVLSGCFKPLKCKILLKKLKTQLIAAFLSIRPTDTTLTLN